MKFLIYRYKVDQIALDVYNGLRLDLIVELLPPEDSNIINLFLQLFQVGQTVLFCIFGLVIWFAVKPSNKSKSIF